MSSRRRGNEYGAAPERMRDVLRGSLGRALDRLPEAERVMAAWTVACGPQMATRGVPVEFAEGVLTVEAVDAAWRRELAGMTERLRAELGRIAGVAVTDIIIVLSAVARKPKTSR